MANWFQHGIDISASLTVSQLFVAIILLSYLLEDLAIITAALLASDNALPPSLALLAIFIGIASGDIFLYGVGALASKWRALRFRLLSHQKMRLIRTRLKRNTLWNIALIRFIPGLRTLGFTLSGLFRINFIHYMFAVLISTMAWTALIFICIYQLGSVDWISESQWKWVIAPVALLGLWRVNHRSSKRAFSSTTRLMHK